MLKSKMNWKTASSINEEWKVLQKKMNLSPLAAKVLSARGFSSVEEASSFLDTSMSRLHDPFLLDGMERAVSRIKQAVEDKEKILIFGDYDADGVSSTTLMVLLLKEAGAVFGWYIPNRFTEGYGPNVPAVEQAAADGASLMITVDTGISAKNEVAEANALGMDVIITDHHEPPPELPEAYAIINPKKPGCPYPFKELAGVGVAFKVAHALLGEVPEHYLDLVTLGTISDLVPLVGENRSMVKKGLRSLTSSNRPGISALKKVCGIEAETMQEDHVGFTMGPRLNAAGRMDSADPAVHLLLSENEEEAAEWAGRIDTLNQSRKNIVKELTETAVKQVEDKRYFENEVIITGGEGWNEGVIGIVASRLVETYHHPVIVLSINAETKTAKGSARSIEGFNMFEHLSRQRPLLEKFGGHEMAAGLSMNVENIESLRTELCRQAASVLDPSAYVPSASIDLQVPLSDITVAALEDLSTLAPFGMANPKPVFLLEDVEITAFKKIGSDKTHLKLSLEQAGSRLDGIAFQKGHLADQMTVTANASFIGQLSINEWNNFRKPQLMMHDMAITTCQIHDKRQQKGLKQMLQALPARTAAVVFQDQTKALIADELPDGVNLYMASDLEEPLEEKYTAFIDIPASLEELNQALHFCRKTEHMYACFFTEEETYFQHGGTREHFKWFYSFLNKYQSFNMDTLKQKLIQQKGWKAADIDFMTDVFTELGFVRMDGSMIEFLGSNEKKPLTESASYRRRDQLKQMEQDLLFSTYRQLKDRLLGELLLDKQDNEQREKVNHGL